MKIIQLTAKSREFFLDMDPLFIMERTTGAFCLGLFSDEAGAEGAPDLPAGLLICRNEDEKLVILWMYIRPGYRMRGLGGELLNAVERMAVGGEIPVICARFGNEPGRGTVAANERNYFKGFGFVDDDERSDVMWISAGVISRGYAVPVDPTADILDMPDEEEAPVPSWQIPREGEKIHHLDLEALSKISLPASPPEGAKVIPLEKLNMDEFVNILGECRENGGGNMLWGDGPVTDIPLDWIDLEISCCIKMEDSVTGILMIGYGEEEELIPVVFFAMGEDNTRQLVAMLMYSTKKALKNYHEKTPVELRLRSDSSRMLAQKLLGIRG